jgi:retron-type reverse transcriptase
MRHRRGNPDTGLGWNLNDRQAACARIRNAIYEQAFLACRYGYRPERGAGDAVRDLTFDLQYGRYGSVVEADIHGFFDYAS